MRVSSPSIGAGSLARPAPQRPVRAHATILEEILELRIRATSGASGNPRPNPSPPSGPASPAVAGPTGRGSLQADLRGPGRRVRRGKPAAALPDVRVSAFSAGARVPGPEGDDWTMLRDDLRGPGERSRPARCQLTPLTLSEAGAPPHATHSDGLSRDLRGPGRRIGDRKFALRSVMSSRRASTVTVQRSFLGSLLGDEGPLPTSRPMSPVGATAGLSVPLGDLGSGAEGSTVLRDLLRTTRPKNYGPSVLMTILGAWAGGGRSLAALASPQVWVVAGCSAGVALASCALNDYFDMRNDAINAPDKPLVRGTVQKDHVVLLCLGLYSAVLAGACMLDSWVVRGIVAASCVATLLYTPLFKRIAFLKNAVVAGTIAASIAAGAAAAGQALAHPVVIGPAAFVFFSMMAREVLMDVADVDGDAVAGVKTVPVLLGRRAGVTLAMAMAVAAGVVAGSATLGAMASASSVTLAQGLGLLTTALAVANLAGAILEVWASSYSKRALDHAIDDAFVGVAISAVVLAMLP